MHARLAFSLAELCGKHNCKILVGNGDQWADGKDMAGLLGLALGPGDKVELSADGENAQEALDELLLFFNTRGKSL
ncbi:MAG: HPr family phosphocarrier protein [Nitrospinae bacterium]|nr:HPr family phosphocarrier protein [Nitrospinota bacterium]